MNILLENVDLRSTSGPNHFGQKLVKYLTLRGVQFNKSLPYDKKLTFIQSSGQRKDLDMYLRLDGIYFNSGFDCERMNHNIKASYHDAKGVIFQTNFNKELIFKWFGPHSNYAVINNGADVLSISDFEISEQIKNRYGSFDNVWSCAASWHSFKRLKENIKYFLEFAGDNDCLIVCGSNPDYVIEHPRIFYVGNLSISELMSVYKISKYFIHLAYLDHCPNVVIDARACGCNIICSSAGGTREIAGLEATIVNEPDWNYSFLESPVPPSLEFDNITDNSFDSKISMASVAKKYLNFLKEE